MKTERTNRHADARGFTVVTVTESHLDELEAELAAARGEIERLKARIEELEGALKDTVRRASNLSATS